MFFNGLMSSNMPIILSQYSLEQGLALLQMNQNSLVEVVQKKNKSYGIEDIYEMRRRFSLTQAASEQLTYMVLAIEDSISSPAQNALLTLLEELPPRRSIVFVVSEAELLLATIRSRCIIIQRQSDSDVRQEYAEFTEFSDLSAAFLSAQQIDDRQLVVKKIMECILSLRARGTSADIEVMEMLHNVVVDLRQTAASPRIAYEYALLLLHRRVTQSIAS